MYVIGGGLEDWNTKGFVILNKLNYKIYIYTNKKTLFHHVLSLSAFKNFLSKNI